MQLRKNIATSESGFIFNPATGDSFSANPLASEIITLLKQGLSASEIKKNIQEKYDVENGQLEKDWDDFLLQLRDTNLLDN
jgi:Coenzyme PQQ synthesis protein D (PqqD)